VQRFDVILATSPPPVALRLAARLGREFGIAWVADFRDPWAVRAPSPWWRWRRRVHTSRAAAIVAVNPALANHLAASLRRSVTTIYNGFEPDETPQGVNRVARRAVFLGTLSESTRLDGLYRALADVDGEFLHIGAHGQYDLKSRAAKAGLRRSIQTGYLPRTEALRQAATGLELTLPTKIFDYIGLGGPILHVGGPGATADALRKHHLGETMSADDVASLAQALVRLWSDPTRIPALLKSEFERSQQAERTARVLSDVLQDRKP
jgi:glycosyltransferase involved in cell wall biosynthesis